MYVVIVVTFISMAGGICSRVGLISLCACVMLYCSTAL